MNEKTLSFLFFGAPIYTFLAIGGAYIAFFEKDVFGYFLLILGLIMLFFRFLKRK